MLGRAGDAHDANVSGSFIHQEHEGAVDDNDFTSTGFDIGGKSSFGLLDVLAWACTGKGMGPSVLFALPVVAGGEERLPTRSATPGRG